jgi:hypothetical protein
VDYCLRLRDNGLRMVFTPFAQLRYRRPMEQMRPAAEAQQRTLFRRQWPDLPPVDPYYNRLYDQSDGQCTLSPF